MGAIPGLLKIVFVVESLLLQIRENQDAPTVDGLAAGIGNVGGRQAAEVVVIVLEGEADLLEVVAALHAASGFAGGTAAAEGEDEENEYSQDAEDYEELGGGAGPVGGRLREVGWFCGAFVGIGGHEKGSGANKNNSLTQRMLRFYLKALPAAKLCRFLRSERLRGGDVAGAH